MTDLARVHEALLSRDHAKALEALLVAWRGNREPALAAMIAHLTRALEPSIAPLEATGPKQMHQAWLTRAKRGDLVDLAMLLRDLFDGPPAHIRARLEALDVYEADPRIAARLVEYVDESGDWLPNTPVGTAIFKALARHGDGGVMGPLRAFAAPDAEDHAWRARKLDALEVAVGKYRVTPLDRAARDVLARVAAIAAGPTTGEASFVAAARDPEARMVATDRLLEEGGPRGEFVILQQLKRTRALTPAERSREQALLVAHRKQWMGGVAKILDPAKAVFEDGVLVGGEVECGTDDLSKVIDAPQWSTVRFVDFGGWKPDLALLRRWPTITRVSMTGADALVAVANAAPALALTGVCYFGPEGERTSTAERAALLVAPGLPALEELTISGYRHAPTALAWILGGALARRLRRIRITRRLGAYDAESVVSLTELLTMLADAPANLEVGTLGSTAGPRIDVSRDDRGRFTRAVVGFVPPKQDVRSQFDKLLAALAGTPKGLLTSVTIDPTLTAPTKAHRARLDAIVAAMI
ncbi:MAG: hypothetical protein NT062_25355 [Proteobacteria bacterium]|nr:hypothetical protein [Pseudomonadota bacterium]